MEDANFNMQLSAGPGNSPSLCSLISHYAGREVSTGEILDATGPVIQKIGYLIKSYGKADTYTDLQYVAQLYAEQFRADRLKALWKEGLPRAS